MRPDRPEKRAVGGLLDSGFDRSGEVLGPGRQSQRTRSACSAPSSSLSRAILVVGGVVPLERLIADADGRRAGYAQGIDEVVDAVVLAQSSAHRSHSPMPLASVAVQSQRTAYTPLTKRPEWQ